MKQLTRSEAAAIIVDALGDTPCPTPFGYGGWSQVLADLACLAPDTIRNMVLDGRKALKKSDTVQPKTPK